MKKLLTLFVISFIIMGCNKKESSTKPEVEKGKFDFTTMVDGVEREYIASIPTGYDGESAVPLVVMLHGTGGNGEKFYNISGWKELGEQENVITVFPSGLFKCVTDDGERKTTSKWNSQPDSRWHYCENVTPPDDIKFFRQMLGELRDKYNIDKRRIYFVGFSNGGQMCAKLSIYMGDEIAAIVESGASFDTLTTFNPVRKMPITYQMGNGDYGPGNEGPFIPLSDLDYAMSLQDHRLYTIVQTNINSFDLDSNYTITGDTNSVVIATFTPKDGNTTNNFNVVFIKGLTHQYPNGKNHWLYGAKVNWEWLKGFTLP